LSKVELKWPINHPQGCTGFIDSLSSSVCKIYADHSFLRENSGTKRHICIEVR